MQSSDGKFGWPITSELKLKNDTERSTTFNSLVAKNFLQFAFNAQKSFN